MTTEEPWPWPDSMDALLAAPTSHRALLDNSRVRVLEAVIEPGAREPEHTHRAPQRHDHRRAGPDQVRPGRRTAVRVPGTFRAPTRRARWMEPEGPHSVENTDQHRYHAIRVEVKKPGSPP